MKAKNVLLSTLLLILYVNLSVISILLLFDLLPRIINTILLYFIFPLVFAYGVGAIGGKLMLADKSEHFSKHIFFKTTMILGLIMWLLVLPASFLGLKNYIQLKTYKTHLVGNVENITNESIKKAGFITINNATLSPDNKGIYHKTSKVKSGENYTTSFYDYYALPVSGSNYKVWICDYTSYVKGADEEDKQAPVFIETKKTDLSGIVVQDKNRLDDYQTAIENSAKQNSIKIADDLIILEYSEGFESTMNSLQNQAFIYFIILNLLFTVLPVILIRKKI